MPRSRGRGQIRPLSRLLLFGGAIAPLLIIQGIVEVSEGGPHPWALLSLGLLACVGPWWFLSRAKRHGPGERVEVVEVRRENPNLFLYLLAYLLPILGLSVRQMDELLAFGLLLLLLAAAFSSEELIHLQPAFLVFRRHVYECREPDGTWFWLLTTSPMAPGWFDVIPVSTHVAVQAPSAQEASGFDR